jgi:hypothetical protein
MRRALIESLALEGTALAVTLGPTLPVDARTLAAATAISVFDRYTVIDRVTIVIGADQVSLSREQVQHLLRSENLAGLDGKQRWRHAVARVAAGLPTPEAQPVTLRLASNPANPSL